MSTSEKAIFVNRFGTLQDVQRATTRNGKPYVKGTLKSVQKTGKGFDTAFTCYKQDTMDAILAAGNGTYISLRGPIEQIEQDGGKFSIPMFKAVLVNQKKAEGAGATAAAAAGTERKLTDEIPF